MSPLLLKLLFTLMPKRAPALLRPLVRKVSNQALTTLVNPQLKQHMDYWEGELAKSEWFAGNEFTGADIQMSFPLEAAAARGGLEQGHPRAMAFLERIHARPAYARALEKGGPYVIGADARPCAPIISSPNFWIGGPDRGQRPHRDARRRNVVVGHEEVRHQSRGGIDAVLVEVAHAGSRRAPCRR